MKIKKLVHALSAALAAASALAAPPTAERRLARTGGEVVRPGSQSGRVSIVNRQGRIPASDCETVAALLSGETGCRIVCDDGEGAAIRLYVVDDPKEPILLVAPEDRWGRLNVARLVDDLPGAGAKEKFLPSRGRKMMIRGLSLLMGGGSSQFPGNIMNAATLRQLDQVGESVPVDMVAHYLDYLRAIGVTPAETATYRKACREGWAPAPTNEIQRAIWEKVHAVPTKPIRIEFDPKRGR